MRWNNDLRPMRARSARRLSNACGFAAVESLEQRALLAADLLYFDLAVAGNVLPGGTTRVNSTIENIGDAPAAAPFDVKFYLSSDNTLDEMTDTLLGTFTYNGMPVPATNGVLGFPFDVTIPGNTATGNWFIVARADSGGAIAEDSESNNVGSGGFFVGNRGATIGDVTASPDPVGTLGIITLTATNVVDQDTIGDPVTVQFFYDDGDGVFSSASDVLIGAGTQSGNDFVYRGALPGAAAVGNRTILAVATDGLDQTVESTTVEIVSAAAPTVGDLLGPAAARRGRGITLTATNVTGSDPSVGFYRDTNGNGTLETGVDQFLGNGAAASAGQFTLGVTISPSWGTADPVFLVQVTDEFGQPSNTESLTVDLLANGRPRIRGGVVASPSPVSKGATLTLTARNVTDDDGPERVQFFRETSGNSVLNPALDESLGFGTRSGNNWSFSFTVPPRFANGINRFYASAIDIAGARSPFRVVEVRVTANTRPRIDAFNINKSTASHGEAIQFLAQRVTDNGAIARVSFYFDSNDNGQFDANDRLIANGNRLGVSNNFRRRMNLPGDLPTGTGRFFAVAFDNLGVRSFVKSDTVNITT